MSSKHFECCTKMHIRAPQSVWGLCVSGMSVCVCVCVCMCVEEHEHKHSKKGNSMCKTVEGGVVGSGNSIYCSWDLEGVQMRG